MAKIMSLSKRYCGIYLSRYRVFYDARAGSHLGETNLRYSMGQDARWLALVSQHVR